MILTKEDVTAMLVVEEFGHYPQEFPHYRRIQLERSGVVEESSFGLKLTSAGAELLLQSPFDKPKPEMH